MGDHGGGAEWSGTYRDAQQLRVDRLAEGQRLGILLVERLQCGHENLTHLLRLKD